MTPQTPLAHTDRGQFWPEASDAAGLHADVR
jgi:hypothetical protein